MAKKQATQDYSEAFVHAFAARLRAGFPIVHVPTTEESRAEALIGEYAASKGYHICTWDVFDGFQQAAQFAGQPEDPNDPHHVAASLTNVKEPIRDPVLALRAVDTLANTEPVIFVFRDLVPLLNTQPVARRAIRTFANTERLMDLKRQKPLILLSTPGDVHQEVRASIHTLELPLPDEAKMREIGEFVLGSVLKNGEKDAAFKSRTEEAYHANAEQLVKSLLGLTLRDAEHVLSLAYIHNSSFGRANLNIINEEKAKTIKKNGVLTYIPRSSIAKREHIGGFDQLLAFVSDRATTYSRAAREAGIDLPKGLALVGPAGTGKSVVGLLISELLDLPCYLMDVAALFGSLVGETEGRLREALRIIEAQNGAVLVIDEIDKGLGNALRSSGDSGVTQRVFGQLLTWLATKQDRTYAVVTANRADVLPPEFLRAGRFDAVFSTDLPDQATREDILRIHLQKRGVMGLDNEIAAIAKRSEDFSGAELEQIVIDARAFAWAERQTGVPTLDELVRAQSVIKPVALRDAEDITKIRNWCKESARPATSEVQKHRTVARVSRAIDSAN